MTIKVRFFASLRESLGTSEKILDVDHAVSVAEVWTLCTMQTEMPINVLAAINQDYVNNSSLVKPGDELAFFPPVTGG